MQTVTLPNSFLQEPGKTPIKWRLWYRSFNAYFGVIDGLKFKADRKSSLLYYYLGVEGQNDFDHLPEYTGQDSEDLDEYQLAEKQLSTYFEGKVNFVVQRHTFFTRVQGQSIDTYVTALKVLAGYCDFESFTSQLIRDQIVCRCYSKMIQQKLLLRNNPSLVKTIDIAKSIECSQLDAKQLEAETPFTGMARVN